MPERLAQNEDAHLESGPRVGMKGKRCYRCESKSARSAPSTTKNTGKLKGFNQKMGLLNIDRDKCQKDEWCVKVCPAGIIRMDKKDGYPVMIPKGELGCIRCGHCVAVCPHGALTHAEVPLSACPPMRKSLDVNTDQAIQFLRSRRSIRSFTKKPMEREAIQRLIETARYAPTAGNAQNLVWLVWRDRDRLRQCAEWTVSWMREQVAARPGSPFAAYLPALVKAWDKGVDVVLRGAPAVVVAAAPKENHNGMVDVSSALTYLTLAAVSMGIGTCWAGLLHGAMVTSPVFRQQFPILESHTHHYPMMVGYTDVRYYRLPERKAPVIHWMD